MRLIDADALSVEVDKSKRNNPHRRDLARLNHINEHDHFQRMIYVAPTVDAVEVVRCKDCKRKNITEDGLMCRIMCLYMKPDDFCSYGEREKDE